MSLLNDRPPEDRPLFEGGPLVPFQVAKWFKYKVFQHGFARPLLNATYLAVMKREGYIAANRNLVTFHERAVRGDLWLSMDDEEICKFADKKARQCYLIAHQRICPERKIAKVTTLLDKYEIDFPGDREDFGIAHEYALARCQDKLWWRRQIRKLQRTELEEYARQSRIVHRKKQIYCSDFNVNLREEQKARNRALLSEMVAINNEGDQYTLEELSDLSVSNPAIRRAELMVRIAGFEEYADRLGYVGEFYTLTCPSKYHPTHITGEPNERYAGFTARQSNQYLNTVWARIRAKLKRQDISAFGFRVAEPNHDGTCHWHLLLFIPSDEVETARDIFRHYALEEDPDEPGAQAHRFKAVAIDKERGTAAGYIAKYISKNIDGYGLDKDNFGNDAKKSSNRVDTWASIHGIRQFQQIGGPSVTVWRELRRLDSEEIGLIEDCRKAADTANWADFCELMGSGRNQIIQLAKWHEFGPETGEMLDETINRYGEPTTGKVYGVSCDNYIVMTRPYRWSISRLSSEEELSDYHPCIASGGANAPPLEFCQ